ncbi:MAG: hypothetical protein R3B84_15160 [Zavarzinella sp.]
MDKSHAVHEVHWKRILKKVLQLRAADPVCLLPGSEYHQYQMNPPCSKEQMQRFEERENCIVPEIMALFMMNVGDGGIGPHRWLYPLETSTPDAFAGTDQWEVLDDDHFLTSFPHIQHWNQEVPAGDEDAFQNYMHPREIRSTLLVTHFFENSSHRTLLMPTKGPERGNLWVDDRTDRRGIYPFLRKGPWSFVSWFEQSLDKMLFRIDQQYEDISRRSFSEYLQFRDEAWAINHAE